MKQLLIWLISTLAIPILPVWGTVDTPGTAGGISNLWLGPTTTALYIVQQIREDDQPMLRIGLRRNTETIRWDQRLGTAKSVVTLGDALYVAFNDGLVVQYMDESPQVILRRLPDAMLPERLFADTPRNRLFVLARQGKPATAPGISATTPAASAPGKPPPGSTRWRVYEMTSGQWSSLTALPREIDSLSLPMMLTDNGQVDLLARSMQDNQSIFKRWTYRNNRWVPQPDLDPGLKVEQYWPLVLDGFPTIVIAAPADAGQVLNIYPITPAASGERYGPLARNGATLILKTNFAVSTEADRIVVAVLSDNQTEMKLARWTNHGQPLGEWEDVVRPGPVRRQDHSLLFTLALIALLLSVFFTRVLPVTVGQELPGGMVLSAYWRRGAAFLVDLTAVFILIFFFLGLYRPDDLKILADPNTLSNYLETGQMRTEMYFISLMTNVVFAGYCAVFEGLFGWTAGKWMFRLQVCQVRRMEDRPTWMQAVVRNAIKVLELQLVFLLFMMLLTRSRQRIGDLLAGTVVLQHRSPREPGPPAKNSDRRPGE